MDLTQKKMELTQNKKEAKDKVYELDKSDVYRYFKEAYDILYPVYRSVYETNREVLAMYPIPSDKDLLLKFIAYAHPIACQKTKKQPDDYHKHPYILDMRIKLKQALVTGKLLNCENKAIMDIFAELEKEFEAACAK